MAGHPHHHPRAVWILLHAHPRPSLPNTAHRIPSTDFWFANPPPHLFSFKRLLIMIFWLMTRRWQRYQGDAFFGRKWEACTSSFYHFYIIPWNDKGKKEVCSWDVGKICTVFPLMHRARPGKVKQYSSLSYHCFLPSFLWRFPRCITHRHSRRGAYPFYPLCCKITAWGSP